MQSKSVIVLLAFCALANAASLKPSALFERTISNMLMMSMEAFASDVVPNKAACFVSYRETVNEHSDEYETEFLNCGNMADAAREDVQNELAADRTQMTATSAGICSEYANCDADPAAIGYFNCYSKLGDEAAKTSNSMAFNANEALQKIKQRFAIIDSDEVKCTLASTYKYEDNMAKAQAALEDCNSGKVTPAPATTTTTSTTSTTTTTVQA